ncbi:MAG: hypothetical protein ACW987_18770 [Candidatus Thorarchaeota archaeon]|jgi:hypothetical protein
MKSLKKKFLLREFGVGAGGTFFRPDTSGVRGQGVGKKAYQFGDDEYPYGTAEPDYGQPGTYDRGSKGGSSHAPVPVPKGIAPDDERWDAFGDIEETEALSQLSSTPPQGNIVNDPGRVKSKFGIPDEEEYPVEESYTMEGLDEMERRLEALGVPFNAARASAGGGGHASGKGGAGQWSSPKGDQFDNHATDDELTRASQGEFIRRDEFNYGRVRTTSEPEEEGIPVPKQMGHTGRFGQTGNANKHSRMSPGMTWKEGTHIDMIEAFVSLSDVPHAEKQCSDPMSDVDLDFSKDSFRRARGVARQRFDTIEDPELVRFLLQIEPDHFMKSLGEIGKDRLVDIYEQWADDVLGGDGQSMDKVTERIMKAIGR